MHWFWLSAKQTVDSYFNDDLPAYAVADFHDKPDYLDKNEQTLLTAQKLIATQPEDAHCRHLVKNAQAPIASFYMTKSAFSQNVHG